MATQRPCAGGNAHQPALMAARKNGDFMHRRIVRPRMALCSTMAASIGCSIGSSWRQCVVRRDVCILTAFAVRLWVAYEKAQSRGEWR